MVYDFCCKLRLQLASKHGPEFNLSSSVNQESGWAEIFLLSSQTISPSLAASPHSLPYLDLILLISPSFLFLITFSSTSHHCTWCHLFPPFPQITLFMLPLPWPSSTSSSSYHPSKSSDRDRFQPLAPFFSPLFSFSISSPALLSVLHLTGLLLSSLTHFSVVPLCILIEKVGTGTLSSPKLHRPVASACLSPINLSCKTHSVDNTQPGLIFPAG